MSRRTLGTRPGATKSLDLKRDISSIHTIHTDAVVGTPFFDLIAPNSGRILSTTMYLDEPDPARADPQFELLVSIDGPSGLASITPLQLIGGQNDIHKLLADSNQSLQVERFDRISFSLSLPGEVWMSFLFKLGF